MWPTCFPSCLHPRKEKKETAHVSNGTPLTVIATPEVLSLTIATGEGTTCTTRCESHLSRARMANHSKRGDPQETGNRLHHRTKGSRGNRGSCFLVRSDAHEISRVSRPQPHACHALRQPVPSKRAYPHIYCRHVISTHLQPINVHVTPRVAHMCMCM